MSHSFFVQFAFYIMKKYSYQVANTCSRFWGAFHQGESFSIAHALLSFRVAQRN